MFGDTLVEDYNLRKVLKKKLYDAGIAKIEIERDATKVRIHLHCARPGIVIGKGGAEIEKLRLECEKMINKNRAEKLAVLVNVVEVKQPDKNAQLVAESIAAQLENRASFRRAMKQAIGRAMRLGAKRYQGSASPAVWAALRSPEPSSITRVPFRCRPCALISTMVLPRLTPLTASIGVKVWIYAGEVLAEKQEASQGRRQQVMLLPKRVKYRRVHRGRMKGVATRGNKVSNGEYGLQALEPAWITSNQIEAARVAMTRYIKRGGQVWIKIFPDKPITEKPAEYPNGFR